MADFFFEDFLNPQFVGFQVQVLCWEIDRYVSKKEEEAAAALCFTSLSLAGATAAFC